ncbi:tetratricopeptide repeat protein [Hahella sp. SMD15-11]|uniref:Tetratricopeptide repeat protein n=1 Tax=Thermohahella caldifontis TaxID=3142973 RepID=A0AB39UUG6_9GAMM
MSVDDPREIPRKREHLIHPVGLLVLAGTITLILYVMFPRDTVFTTSDALARPDALSIAYLRVLLRSDPDNSEVRLHLIRQLRLTGQYREALALMGPLLDDPVLGTSPEVFSEYINLLAQDMFSRTRPDEKVQAQRRLELALRRMTRMPWPEDRIRATLELTRNWVRPSTRVELLEWLLARTQDAGERLALHQELATLYAGQGDIDSAESHLNLAWEMAPDGRKPALALRLLDILLASGDPYRALIRVPGLIQHHPLDRRLLEKGRSIALQAGRPDLALQWQRQRYALTPEDSALAWALMEAELGQGHLEAARELVPIASKQAHTPERVRRIAQILTWSGDPNAAFAWWERYASMTRREADREFLWKQAIGLYRLNDARRILESIAAQRPLTRAEREELFGLYLDVGDTAAARAMLERERARNPDEASLTQQLYSLYIDLRDWPAAVRLLEAEEQAGRLTAEQRLELANLTWLLRRPEQALTVLDRAPPDERNAAYWDFRLQLAVYLEDFDDAASSLTHLMALPDGMAALSVEDFASVGSGLALTGRYGEAARLMWAAGQRNQRTDILLRAVQLAMEARLWQEAGEWLATMPVPGTDAERALWWGLKARLAAHQGHQDRAIGYWEQATIYAPDDPNYRDAFMWALIGAARGHADTLASYLNYYRRTGVDDSRLWPLLAYGYMALGDTTQALAWFRLGLLAYQRDVDWLMGMAEAFHLAGYEDYAQRLKRHVWRTLAPRLQAGLTLDNERSGQALRLAHEYAGPEVADRALTQPGITLTDDERLTLLLEWALAEGHRILADVYSEQAAARALTLPGWQQLAMALQRNDGSALEKALADFDNLPLSDATLARFRLGRRTQALTYGLTALTDTLDETNVSQVRALVATLRTGLEDGVRILHRRQKRDVLTLASWGFTWAELQDEQRWQLDLDQHGVTPDTSVLNATGDQQDISLQWQTWGRDWTLTATAAYRVRDTRSTAGVSLNWEQDLDEGLRIGATLNLDMRPDISGTTWAWGQETGLRGRLDYGIDSRTTLALEAGWRRIDSVYGPRLGQGPHMQGGITHTLFAEDPAWQVSGDVQWYRFSGDPLADARLNSHFVAAPSADTILPREFGRVGVSTRWYHGEVHRIAHEVPSPRWHFGVNAGYQWTRDVLDYGLTAGIGWRVTGDDELALSLDWSSETATGSGQSLTLTFSYNSYTGR